MNSLRGKIAALLLLVSFAVTPYLPKAQAGTSEPPDQVQGLYTYMGGWLIAGSIGELSEYNALLLEVLNAKEGDEIQIYIDSPGGQMMAGWAIREAMLSSKARIWVHCVLCSSAAGYIASGGTDLLIYEQSLLVVHLANDGHVKYSEGAPYALSLVYAEQVLKALHLPADEVQNILVDVRNGVDYWLRASYICQASKRSILKYGGCYISMR